MRGPRNRPPGLQNKEARGSFMKQPPTAADGDGQRSAGEDARSLKEQERSLTRQHPPSQALQTKRTPSPYRRSSAVDHPAEYLPRHVCDLLLACVVGSDIQSSAAGFTPPVGGEGGGVETGLVLWAKGSGYR